MKKTGLIYSFNTNKTSQAAKKIGEQLGNAVVHVNVENITEKEFLSYDKMILGVATWFDGELPNYWDEFVPALEDMKLKGKTIAIFGNGNQKDYPENFVDGIGILGKLL
ncbi:MAG: flavodoxin domain-containing protein, partial [Bacteroidales bacterium]